MKKSIVFVCVSLSAQIGFASTARECIKKIDQARVSLLEFKDGKGSEATVNETAQEATRCLDALDAGSKVAKKDEAVKAWKEFRAIREEKLIPAIKAGKKEEAGKLATDNKVNLDKTKNALNAIAGE